MEQNGFKRYGEIKQQNVNQTDETHYLYEDMICHGMSGF